MLSLKRDYYFLAKDNKFVANGDIASLALTNDLALFVANYSGFRGAVTITESI